MERQLRTLEGLLALDALELRPTLDQAARLLAEVLGTDKIDVFLYQAANQTLVALGVSPTPMGRREIAIGMDCQPIANHGRAVEVFQTGRPYLSGHVDQDLAELVGIREGLGVRSEMIVPLDVAGQRRGVLMANSATPEAFPETDLDFLGAVAHWLGLVLHRTEQAEQLARQAEERGRRAAIEELVNRLTPREQEVAALVALGLSNAEIARRLVITEGTVANHIRSILHKLGVPSRARVAAIMAQLGIEPPSEDGTGGS
ncbi:MAG TPA: LuxR C-terminal-related transcriptional regulator [Dehalococcoidia bacterium]|nr:LuxR C-terminal-related transcriptional regulator [Dehalococcoidia bacterium]